ncbi:hypothetical protein KIPB_015376 [Kipferlia bialata]|uniref:Uncharacterized protein n=1 Tax=Kipferlia bialata TaxID=797122 RepID=A0A9K3DBX5_9EUKA|nr:hypothetical protein KIPB_015376 [Kipferlia bialata]|eukprot:g15376.t1
MYLANCMVVEMGKISPSIPADSVTLLMMPFIGVIKGVGKKRNKTLLECIVDAVFESLLQHNKRKQWLKPNIELPVRVYICV